MFTYSHWEGRNNAVSLKTLHGNSGARTRNTCMALAITPRPLLLLLTSRYRSLIIHFPPSICLAQNNVCMCYLCRCYLPKDLYLYNYLFLFLDSKTFSGVFERYIGAHFDLKWFYYPNPLRKESKSRMITEPSIYHSIGVTSSCEKIKKCSFSCNMGKYSTCLISKVFA